MTAAIETVSSAIMGLWRIVTDWLYRIPELGTYE